MNIFYKDDLVTLYLADCVDILPSLKFHDSLVVADPPYGQTSLKWDRWEDAWIGALDPCIRSLWCFGTMRMFLQHGHCFMERGWKLSQDLVWEKHNGSSFHADRFRRVHESICHFYRGDWSTVRHTAPVTFDARKRVVRRKRRPAHMNDINAGFYLSEDGGPRLTRSVLFYRSMHGKAVHPTQKPVDLIRPLIEYGAGASTRLIVPFAGSGSELIAAKELGIHAIGIESQERYCEEAAKRLFQGVFSFEQNRDNARKVASL